jgi:peptidyl-tRNA hydrolase
MKSMGKAMAQAGHGALMCADALGDRYSGEFARWRRTGRGGEVRVADAAQWEELKAQGDCVAVRDAGFTQVAPGTETVLAFPPCDEPSDRVRELPLVP